MTATAKATGDGAQMTGRAAFRRGALAALPFFVIVVPFALLFGVVARDAGLDLLQTMAMSMLVLAGAAQFTALSLLQEQAPVFVAVLAALLVNLRMAMYSAALAPYLGQARLSLRALVAYLMVDQAFALAVREYEDHPKMPLQARVRFYLGVTLVIMPLWFAGSFVGAIAGNAIPAQLSLDFALPIAFIAMTAPMIRSLPHVVAVLVSVTAAIVFAGLPYSLGLFVAAVLAMVSAAQCERLLAHRRAARQE